MRGTASHETNIGVGGCRLVCAISHRSHGRAIYPDWRDAEGVCRNHRGEPAARVPSAGIHSHIFGLTVTQLRRSARCTQSMCEPSLWFIRE